MSCINVKNSLYHNTTRKNLKNERNQEFPYTDYLVYLQHTDEKRVATNILYHFLQQANHYNTSAIRLLDVGCGNGEVVANFITSFGQSTQFEVTLLEPNGQLLVLAQEKLKQTHAHVLASMPTKIEAATKIERDQHGFDLILALNLLYYVEDKAAILSALYDALVPGGYLCVSLQMSTSDIFAVRSVFRKYYRLPDETRFTIEKLLKILEELCWQHELQIVSSRVTFPMADVEDLLEHPRVEWYGRN